MNAKRKAKKYAQQNKDWSAVQMSMSLDAEEREDERMQKQWEAQRSSQDDEKESYDDSEFFYARH